MKLPTIFHPLYAVLTLPAFLFGINASAHDDPSKGYAHGGGTIVLDGRGDCVRTGAWTIEAVIRQCDPNAQPEPEPEPVAEAAPAPAPPPPPKQIAQTITLGAGALFDVDSAVIKPEGRAELDTFANKVKQLNSVESITISGHTDSTGSSEYNEGLSIRRANAVWDYLESRGIDRSYLRTEGWGEERPIASNDSPAGRAQNRRVEINLRGTSL